MQVQVQNQVAPRPGSGGPGVQVQVQVPTRESKLPVRLGLGRKGMRDTMIPCHDPSETSRWQREMDKGEKSPGPRVTVYSKANTVNEQVSVTARRDEGVDSEAPAETHRNASMLRIGE